MVNVMIVWSFPICDKINEISIDLAIIIELLSR